MPANLWYLVSTHQLALERCGAVLLLAGGKAKDAFGVDQLCAELEAGTEGTICAMQLMLEEHEHEDDDAWGFLLVDMCTYIFQRRKPYRHAVDCASDHDECRIGFTFNCYRYWTLLVIRFHSGIVHNIIILAQTAYLYGYSLTILE
jgi:hypothetical protein